MCVLKAYPPGITRPKGRVRIETGCPSQRIRQPEASPGRKAGCGLKQDCTSWSLPAPPSITRPKGRVRIETFDRLGLAGLGGASPGRKAGCGLKRDDGRHPYPKFPHHPAERPGAD